MTKSILVILTLFTFVFAQNTNVNNYNSSIKIDYNKTTKNILDLSLFTLIPIITYSLSIKENNKSTKKSLKYFSISISIPILFSWGVFINEYFFKRKKSKTND